ncbi:MAG: hypothetical protein FJ320_00790 [SAR202 cluster bacterium]|nr:hypothetical protein [SAR202 cluster bacterium]
MYRHDLNASRRDLRQGSGADVDAFHIDEVLGSTEFYIYITPNKKAKGYEVLKAALEATGCKVEVGVDPMLQPGERYHAVAITHRDGPIADAGLRRAHKWAHQRNFLHSFFKPMFRPAP